MECVWRMRFGFLVSFFLFFLTPYPVGAEESKKANFDTSVTVRDLNTTDKAWFMKEFPRSFMEVYKGKVFIITKNKQAVILGPSKNQEKEQWLIDTAKEEFKSYIEEQKVDHKAILILYNNVPVGSFFYRLLDKEKILYFAQCFILPEFQKKGLCSYFIQVILPKLYPDYRRYEVLARDQNDAALLLYRKLDFSIGDIALAQKYGYDPLRYTSFYKILSSIPFRVKGDG